MTDEMLASRRFGMSDQIAFAKWSSDWNPMHLDHAFARRTQVGAPVVHGIHNLAWAANAVLERFPLQVANIRARFLQPLYLDETARIWIRERTEQQVEFEVVAENTVVAHVNLSTQPGKSIGQSPQPAPSGPVRLAQPANLPFEQLAAQSGAVPTGDDGPGSAFSALTGGIGSAAVKALLATSQIVGMACPGLHSLFAGLDINCEAKNQPAGALAYRVSKTDARFRSLQIDVAGSGITGRLEAFARLAPPSQPGMSEISQRMTGRPFAGQRSLIIGGSRGLGEVTAKIVAAGGGLPVITYRDNPEDAERVSADILAGRGQCERLHYDVLAPAAVRLQQLGKFDCAYYFATPKIFQRKSALFEPEKLRNFLRYYADGFFDLCIALAARGTEKISMFYPSTVAIDDAATATTEYAMAKMSGETLVKHINHSMPNIHVITRRLPRILTDQTATVGVASADNALDVMIPIVYEVQQKARPASAPRG